MSFRTIIIVNPAQISIKNDQLMIRTDSDHSIPIEDISAIMLESRQSTITTAALSRLGQCGCAVFTCDEKHMPCGVTVPFCQHFRQLGSIELQLSASGPLKKKIWQAIIKSKIENQSGCLRLSGEDDLAEKIKALSGEVKSGDIHNTESTAAQMYFPGLFGKGYTRSAEEGRNAALNYGYTILRGYMARTLTVYGFLPTLGIHHYSQVNAFNLADDFMEPFRPVVDLLVSRTVDSVSTLSPEIKRTLFNCLNLNILSDKQNHSVAYAMEKMVQSYIKSLKNKTSELCLPEIVELELHRYE